MDAPCEETKAMTPSAKDAPPAAPACDHSVTYIDGVMRYPPNVDCIGDSADGCTDYFQCATCVPLATPPPAGKPK